MTSGREDPNIPPRLDLLARVTALVIAGLLLVFAAIAFQDFRPLAALCLLAGIGMAYVGTLARPSVRQAVVGWLPWL